MRQHWRYVDKYSDGSVRKVDATEIYTYDIHEHLIAYTQSIPKGLPA